MSELAQDERRGAGAGAEAKVWGRLKASSCKL